MSASGTSTIGTYFIEEKNLGGWSMIFNETEEAHGVYESLKMTPDCDTTGRCWKGIQLSNGFHLSAMKLVYVSLGHPKVIHSLTLGQGVSSLSEYRKLKFPLRIEITERADQDLLIASLEGIRFGVDLLSERFRIYCNDTGPVAACYLDVRDLNYSSVSRGSKKNRDQETVSRGTSYSTIVMPDWSVGLMGGAADILYDAINVSGGKYETKSVELTPTAKLRCAKRTHASDPYTVCSLSISDRSREAFVFPLGLELDFADATHAFAADFSFQSPHGVLSINCQSRGRGRVCHLRIQNDG
ncbi:MAG: hypothetical protein HYR96_05675 [Deltaproteobacteria bacterium]|nr:hypothetical protein [Deltaproteobacteria bacterium]